MGSKIKIPADLASKELLLELYAMAEKFYNAAPWEELSDSDWFSFPDPATEGEFLVYASHMDSK